jgi:Domain of unknown function (DUF4276)
MSQTNGVRVNIIVEGQTEREFVRDVLREALAFQQIYLTARAVETSRDRRANKIYRGGLLNYSRSKKDVLRWLDQDKDAFVTTMFDLYGLPKDFPGYQESLTLGDPYKKVDCIEQGIKLDVNHPRFIPYIQLYEFESLLFSSVDALCSTCGLNEKSKVALQTMKDLFITPEHINDTPQTAPSKRILSIHSSYEKINDGVQIAKKIGIAKLRQECLHFHNWLELAPNSLLNALTASTTATNASAAASKNVNPGIFTNALSLKK